MTGKKHETKILPEEIKKAIEKIQNMSRKELIWAVLKEKDPMLQRQIQIKLAHLDIFDNVLENFDKIEGKDE